jgi:hypothetical protein
MTITEQRKFAAELDALFKEYGETLVGAAIGVCVRLGLGRPSIPIADIRFLCSLWMRQLAAQELSRRAMAEASR